MCDLCAHCYVIVKQTFPTPTFITGAGWYGISLENGRVSERRKGHVWNEVGEIGGRIVDLDEVSGFAGAESIRSWIDSMGDSYRADEILKMGNRILVMGAWSENFGALLTVFESPSGNRITSIDMSKVIGSTWKNYDFGLKYSAYLSAHPSGAEIAVSFMGSDFAFDTFIFGFDGKLTKKRMINGKCVGYLGGEPVIVSDRIQIGKWTSEKVGNEFVQAAGFNGEMGVVFCEDGTVWKYSLDGTKVKREKYPFKMKRSPFTEVHERGWLIKE